MPKAQFQLSIEDFSEVHELPDSWPLGQLHEVLHLMDFDDDVDEDELPDMTLMALQDLEVDEACDIVLQAVFGDEMRSGVRQNLIDDLEDDRPWEQFTDVGKQSGIFEALVLLQRAFPRRFGTPDAVRLRLRVNPTDAETREWLDEGPSSGLLLRLMASGMDENTVLPRLYEDEIAGNAWADADALLWHVQEVASDASGKSFDIWSSWQWLGPLEDVTDWQGSGWPDGER